MSADLQDTDASGAVSSGDRITITFSAEVLVSAAANPATDLVLPVSGDSFGQGAVLVPGVIPLQAVVILGSGTQLRVSGLFDPFSMNLGDASGIAATTTTNITDAFGNSVVFAPPVDLSGPFQEGFSLVAGSLNHLRGLHTATTLNDGRVLIVGGVDAQAGQATFVPFNEIFDPLTGTFTDADDPSLGGNPGGFLAVATSQTTGIASVRFFHSATKLSDGRVLIAGGAGVERLDANGQPIQEELASSFLFDPSTNQFTRVGDLNLPRRSHYAVLLTSGQVLIAGGFNSLFNSGQGSTVPAAELFDPQTGLFSPIDPTGLDMQIPRQNGSATALSNGGAMFVGGAAFVLLQGQTQPQLYLAQGAEQFDAVTGTFSIMTGPNQDRRYHSADVLDNGDLLVAGGDANANLDSIERFDGATGQWSSAGTLITARTRHASARVGRDVLLIGGQVIDFNTGAVASQGDAEVWSGSRGSVAASLPLQAARASATAVTLNDGRVLLTGGFSGGTTLLGLDGASQSASEIYSRN